MSKHARILLGGVMLALMLANYGINLYSKSLPAKGSYDGWTGRREIRGGVMIAVIVAVDPNGPANVLRIGDEIIALNEVKIGDDAEIINYNRRVPPGTSYTMTIRRDGQLQTVALYTVAYRSDRRFNPLFLAGALFLLVGVAVFLLRPDDKQAWLLAMMFGMLPGVIESAATNLPPWLTVINVMARGVGLLSLPLFAHFFLVFPGNSPLLRRWPRLEAYLYLPFVLFIAPQTGAGMLSTRLAAWVSQSWLFLFQNRWFRPATILAYLVAGLIFLLINYRDASQTDKRRLRVVMAGSGVGFFNLFLMPMGELTGLMARWPVLWSWFDMALIFTFPFIPLAFVYAIVKHKVIPVSLIIRRSVRYLLVSRGAILLDMIAAGLSVTAVLTYVFSRTRPPVIVIGLVSAAVGIITWKIASSLHGKYLAPLIDRHFFRQSYDAQQIIAELTGALRTVTGLPQLLELVATKIQTALQTVNVTIFLRDQTTGSYYSAYSHGYSETDGRAISHALNCQLTKSVAVIEQASDNGQPVEIRPDGFLNGQDSDGRDSDGMSATDRETLEEVKATLLMPLASKDELLGLISLGPRLGDLPFSREDKQLLMSVSGPTTFAIENARLVEQMVAEARRLQEIEVDHRRKTEELAFARQLQLSMLPMRNVSLDHIEVIGQMRTATEVGGDYYDFIEMTDGRICIAVGDATGHGMAAGLVVGMVKMGLINGLQRMNGHASVKLLVEDLNRALKRSLSQRGMGMCLGAAILDTSTLQVEVISNGMPAPYHYRSASRSLFPIPTQAPPLGFLRQVNVRPVEMRLQPGDALIWLSDGFEERLNQVNQVWGSEQVEQALERICGEDLSAENIARRMIEACDGAAGGRSNDDDMSIVVAKVKAKSAALNSEVPNV